MLDIIASVGGLLFLSPVLWLFMGLIWLQDRGYPFYIAERVGQEGTPFRMIKLRSMVMGADKTGVDSTAAGDARITWVGRIIRRYKLDEFAQLWNVLKGEMSLVGPRPNVPREVALYTPEERRLLHVKPGLTDFASIVFADEGEVLAGSDDPDLKYHQLIRPWKSRLGLLYVGKRSFFLDLHIIWLTLVTIFSRENALRRLQRILRRLGADDQLRSVASRKAALVPYPPPGSDQIVDCR